MKTIFYFLMTILFLSISCEGPEGPAGANGQDGEDGLNGNANVKSFTFSVYYSDWTTYDYYAEYEKNVPILTQDIYNSGAVLVYLKATDGEAYQQLPFTWQNTNTFHRYWSYVNKIKLQIFSEDLIDPIPSNFLYYKVIAISGNAYNAGKSANLNFKNYHEVAKYYGL